MLLVAAVAMLCLALVAPLVYAKDSGAPLSPGSLASKSEPKREPADLEAKLSPELKAFSAALKGKIDEVKRGDNYVKAERLVMSQSGMDERRLN